MKKKVTILVALAAMALLVLLPVGGASAAPPPVQGVRITPIGNPTWKPVDFHLFSAPMGTAQSGYAEFQATQEAILPRPNHVWIPALGIGPGAPHQPPYNTEMATGIANQGYHQGVQFDLSEFSNGMGVWVTWMTVPAPGTTGSSPDFDSGPIMANSLFPIHFHGETWRNHKLWNPYVGDFYVPALDQIDPPFLVDGASHFPMFLADNADFGPPGGKLNGSYEYRMTMIDATGNGWNIVAHFAIGP